MCESGPTVTVSHFNVNKTSFNTYFSSACWWDIDKKSGRYGMHLIVIYKYRQSLTSGSIYSLWLINWRRFHDLTSLKMAISGGYPLTSTRFPFTVGKRLALLSINQCCWLPPTCENYKVSFLNANYETNILLTYVCVCVYVCVCMRACVCVGALVRDWGSTRTVISQFIQVFENITVNDLSNLILSTQNGTWSLVRTSSSNFSSRQRDIYIYIYIYMRIYLHIY